MKKKVSIFIVYSLLLLMTGCEKFTEPTAFEPTFSINDATEITRLSATLSGSIQKQGGIITSYGFIYGKLESLADGKVIEFKGEPAGTFSATFGNDELPPLTPGERYYFCLWAGSSESYQEAETGKYGLAKSEIRQFQTSESSAPTFGTTEVADITEQSVTVRSNRIDEGGSAILMMGFAYHKAGSSKDNLVLLDNEELENENFSITIEGLESGTTYTVRSFGFNSAGIGYGESQSFTTVNSYAPTLSILNSPTTIRGSWIIAQGTIISTGINSSIKITQRGFCWSKTNNTPTKDQNDGILYSDSITATYKEKITDLEGSTKYYIRAWATNESGETGHSKIIEFTTLPITLPAITQLTYSNLTARNVNVEATVGNGNGIITKQGFYLSRDNATPDEANHDKEIVVDNDISLITGTFTGLVHNTTYHIRAFAVNEAGINYSDAIDITTAIDPTPGEDDNESPEL